MSEPARDAGQADDDPLGLTGPQAQARFMSYRKRILGALRSFPFDDQEKDELVQEAVVRARESKKLTARLAHDPTIDPVPYMKVTAMNLARSRLRRAKKEVPAGAEAELAALERTLREDGEDDVWDRVREGIAQISATQPRQVLTLQSQGMSTPQISASLERPAGQVNVERHRGVRALQEMPELRPYIRPCKDETCPEKDGE